VLLRIWLTQWRRGTHVFLFFGVLFFFVVGARALLFRRTENILPQTKTFPDDNILNLHPSSPCPPPPLSTTFLTISDNIGNFRRVSTIGGLCVLASPRPRHHWFNLSMSSGIFPEQWKAANVIPLLTNLLK
jgi:hypothetical protein